MKDFKSVREALQKLVDFTDPDRDFDKDVVKVIGAKKIEAKHKASKKEMAEEIYQTVAWICDELGMSDIYLGK